MQDFIDFYKMSGAGNDFIVVDNRDGRIGLEQMPELAVRACRRRMSAGADGMFFIVDDRHVDFKWHFFNADGSRAEMCGNGARCVARYALLNGIAGADMTFETDAGNIHATVMDRSVRIQMTDPHDLVATAHLTVDGRDVEYGAVNTGVPHVVIPIDDVNAADVVAIGRPIRYHDRFAPAGTNVNIVSPLPDNRWAIRTYERGVEDETLACGTGNVATALILATRYDLRSPVTLVTRGGTPLKVHFQRTGDEFGHVCLEGDARVIYQGRLWPEGWRYGGNEL